MLRNTEKIKNRRYLVPGAARSGIASAEFLAAHGAVVTISDIKNENDITADLTKLKELGVNLDLGGHTEEYFTSAEVIVLSPGIPQTIPLIQKAKTAGVEIISEIELAFRHTDASVIGITGSNGKTTTTALTGSIMRHAGLNSMVCGNIGNSFIGELNAKPETEYFVVELSSFQLETVSRFKPHAAAILNITPDHMDRYATVVDYAEAKFRLFMNQDINDFAILNYDDLRLRDYAKKLNAKVMFFSSKERVENGIYLQGSEMNLVENGKIIRKIPDNILILKGRHNLENFMAACLLSRSVGVSIEDIIKAAKEFEPIEHRIEYVRTFKGAEFYNDSKATNVDSAIKAIESFPANLILIMGGKDKAGDFTVLTELLAERVKTLVITGDASEKIRKQVGDSVEHVVEKDFDNAVRTAVNIAEEGDIVLLAPACASFDQFNNYEERGRRFKELVNSANGFEE